MSRIVRIGLFGVVVAVALTLSALGYPGPSDPPDAEVAASADTPHAPDASARTAAGPVGRAACGDPAGDVRRVDGTVPDDIEPGTDLTEVALDGDGERLEVTFTATEPIERDGPTDVAVREGLPVQWAVWLLDGSDVVYQLRLAWREAGWELLRDDLRWARSLSLAPPTLAGPRLSFAVDLADLPRLPDEFGWVALTTAGETPVQDVCPNAANDSLAPDVQQQFPDRP